MALRTCLDKRKPIPPRFGGLEGSRPKDARLTLEGGFPARRGRIYPAMQRTGRFLCRTGVRRSQGVAASGRPNRQPQGLPLLAVAVTNIITALQILEMYSVGRHVGVLDGFFHALAQGSHGQNPPAGGNKLRVLHSRTGMEYLNSARG